MSLRINGRQIRGVAFDLEGTIVDLEPLHFAAHVETAKMLGLPIDLDNPETFTKHLPHFIGGPLEKIMEELLALAKWKGSEKEAEEMLKILSAKDSEIFRNLRDAEAVEIEPREGFMEVFEEIKRHGLPVAIGSLTEKADAEIILRKSGLDKLFAPENIVLRENVQRLKPDPEMYIKTAECMRIPTGRQLVFEDSHNGVRAAKDAGSVPVGVPTRFEESIILRMWENGARFIFKDWESVGYEFSRPREGEVPIDRESHLRHYGKELF